MSYINIGEPAPLFTGIDQDGNEVKLEDFIGKKVVLYFYPKDSTPGCTTEACDFRDHQQSFSDKNTVIIGVSKDSVKSHTRFIEKNSLPFTLISDEDGSICQAYGVWQLKKNYGKEYMGIVRTTYIINEEGNVEDVIPVKRVKGHVEGVLENL